MYEVLLKKKLKTEKIGHFEYLKCLSWIIGTNIKLLGQRSGLLLVYR